MKQTPTIVHWGISYRSAPLAVRERLYFDENTLRQKMTALKQLAHLSELLIFQTCHRFEIFLVPISGQPAKDLVLHELLDGEAMDCGQSYENQGAVRYLFKVVASLDSVMIGETQVTSQFRKSKHLAEQAGTLGPVLSRLSDAALRVSKKIRSETDLSRGTVSLGHAALTLARTVYHDLQNCQIAILGAGQMASLCFEYAARYKPRQIMVINRSRHRAKALASLYPRATDLGLEDISLALESADIIISCIEPMYQLITKTMMSSAMAARRRLGKQYLYICDMAMPRSVDPELSTFEEVYLFDIDDLKLTVENSHDQRCAAAAAAEPMIERGVSHFFDWLAASSTKPYASKFQTALLSLVQKEIEQTLKKQDFDASHRPHLEKLGLAITRKVSACLAQSLPPGSDFHESGLLHNLLDQLSRLSKQDHPTLPERPLSEPPNQNPS